MLVVTRRVGESLNLGDDIFVTIVSVRGSTVKIGIKAPREVRVLRGELAESVKKENIEAISVLDTGPEAVDGLAEVLKSVEAEDSE